MRLFAQNRVCARALSRRERDIQRDTRVTVTIAVVAGVVLWTLMSAVYAHADCDSCLRWMQHLAAHGFRTQLGPQSDWSAVRAELALAPAFRSSLTAVVDGGLLIEGPVPSRDIHRALELRSAYDVRALVVPGVPRGSPGASSALPGRYTVFVVRDGGRIQTFTQYEYVGL
jgi:hypothetical protein